MIRNFFIKVFDIIGYAKTATSPQEAKPLLFLDSNHEVIINRNNLFQLQNFIEKNREFKPPAECTFKLSGNQVRQKMQMILDGLYNSKKILDHGMVVGKELAYVLSGGDTEKNKEITENQMYDLELKAL